MKKGRKSIFSENEQAFMRENYLTMRYKDIAEHLGYTERQIRGWVNNHCKKKNRTFNSEYFDSIDIPTKAYFLGFIYADGWVSRYTRRGNVDTLTYELGMELQRGDRYILEALNTELGGVHLIKDVEKTLTIANNPRPSHVQTSILRVYSKRIVNALVMHGIAPDKTYSDTYPAVPQELLPYFLRGYFDGDGCVSSGRHGKPVIHFTAFGDTFLMYLQDVLEQRYGIKSAIYSECDHKHRLMIFRNEDVRKFFEMIYGDGCDIMLMRKYNKFTTLLGLAA